MTYLIGNLFSILIFEQSQMDDKDRTIRIQQNRLDQYENEKSKIADTKVVPADAKSIDTATCATQTERVSRRFKFSTNL